MKKIAAISYGCSIKKSVALYTLSWMAMKRSLSELCFATSWMVISMVAIVTVDLGDEVDDSMQRLLCLGSKHKNHSLKCVYGVKPRREVPSRPPVLGCVAVETNHTTPADQLQPDAR